MYKFKQLAFASLLSVIVAACGGGGSSDEQTSSPVELQPADPTNHSPILTVIESQTTFSQTPKTVVVHASDSDDDVLTYSATSSVNSVTVNWDDINLTLTPGDDFYGSVDITVTVSDGSLSDSSSFKINVLKTSIPPTPKFERSQLSIPPTVPSL